MSLEIVRTLRGRLHACEIINEAGKSFIPDGILEHLLDENTVRSLLKQLVSQGEPLINDEEYTPKLCNQNRPFRKILTILLLIELPCAIKAFMDLGIDDSALPMQDPERFLSCEHLEPSSDADSKSNWKLLAESGLNHANLHEIYRKQWCVLAPHFGERGSIPHYKLTQNDILPFLQIPLQSPSHSEVLQSSNQAVIYGSFSQVRKVEIHPNHHDFGDYGISNPDNHFAIKSLQTNNYDDFAQEIEIFKRYWKSKLHIVSLLSTFEITETVFGNHCHTYCLIFPWAKGNLMTFWEMNGSLVRNQKVLPWITRECYEIVRALSYIHGDIDDQIASADSFGRHGDIQPSNILWYPNPPETNLDDFGKLVLADFGLADFHRASSKSNSSMSSLPVSVTYRAPEFDTSEVISQKIDIWALGCTFLEYITWFLKGYNAVQGEFRGYRSEFDKYKIFADIFFRVQTNNGLQDVFLKPQVMKWIILLRQERSCSKYLKEFLNIIQEDMLVVDRLKRGSAEKICQKLEKLYRQYSVDMDYCQHTKPASPITNEKANGLGNRPASFLRKVFRRHFRYKNDVRQ